MDQAELAAKFRNKDIKAFERIYSDYSDSLFGVIFGIVRDREIAEEVLQDVFFKAWDKAETYSAEKGRLFTWLLNISRNSAIDKTRSKGFKNKNKNSDSSFYVDILETRDKTEIDIDVNYIRSMLGRLKERCVKLIELLYFKGFTQKEVSEELDIPLGTVKTNNRNCISELRKLIQT
ncbi:RNA polymerase sigma factor [Robertkochia solimangrovi]|uniref:RNA polymerase sigma factor n=1 Tax=Robertkochia solimangrovi TaxID=2213046 RepID=UPI00117CE20B|nr:sigma-70 family RNA polymerase sigma factor [Robertkochia solimangrovi]TRZ45063.1 RNA polymerase subunit sigma-70 [Robertkochia solimangrovi]